VGGEQVDTHNRSPPSGRISKTRDVSQHFDTRTAFNNTTEPAHLGGIRNVANMTGSYIPLVTQRRNCIPQPIRVDIDDQEWMSAA
jgi:hypothetical protein